MNAKFIQSECVADVLAGINEKRDATSRSLTLHYETSSEWLAEAIQTCKRKILEGTGQEISEPKRMKPMTESDKENAADGFVHNKKPVPAILKKAKPTTESDKENAAESVGDNKKSVQAILKKAMSAASVKKTVAASVKKETAPKLDAHPSYLCVMSLKVADLRSELQQRGLDTTGLKKKELQNRLLREVEGAESKLQESKNATKPAVSLEKAEKVGDEVSDIQMKDATKDHTDAKMDVYAESVPSWNESMPDVTAMAISGKQATASDDQDTMPQPDLKVTIVGKSFLKSTAELFSPSKIASKFQSSKHGGDVAEPSSRVSNETKQDPDAIQPSKNLLVDSFKKSASTIFSASPVGKSKPVQANNSPFPKVKTAPVAAKRTVVVDLVDLTETKTSSAQLHQPASSSKSQSQEQEQFPKPVAHVPSKPNSAGTATKEKRDKATADRMARLAEMRGKSKPVAGSKPVVVNNPPALSASKRLPLSSAKDSKSNRRVLLTAQMREKAAAGMKLQQSSKVLASSKAIPASKVQVVVSQVRQAKAQETVAPVVSKQVQAKETVAPVVSQQAQAKETVAPVVSQQPQAKETVAPVASQEAQTKETVAPVVSQEAEAKVQKTVAPIASQQSQVKVQETVAPIVPKLKEANVKETVALCAYQQKEAKPQESVALVSKVAASPNVVRTKKLAASTPSAAPRSVAKTLASSAKKPAQRPDILSPMSTYEISDREQSDTDDSDSECDQNRKKKKVPRWAQRSNLLPALESQYANRDGRLDPETIFPPVSSCNLEEIFDQKKTRYNRRTSSANWTKDGVTELEIVAYKRTMGY